MTGAPTWSVPPNIQPAECRSCGKRIFWIRTKNEKLMPIDCAVPGGREPSPSSDGLGVAHFATCKQADQWRKPKR